MIDREFLIAKYSEEEVQKILDLQKKLSEDYPDMAEDLADCQEVAKIVIGLKLDAKSVQASIIFPFVKNQKIDISSIEDEELKTIVSMLITCDNLSFNYSDADGLKEMLLAITKDIRVIIIKSAEMLIFARKNVKNTSDENAIRIFRSIDDIFSPISARLGLSEIKSEFQDLSFEFHDPKEYERLKEEVKNETRSNVSMINGIVSDIKKLLQENGIDATCYGRVKHLSSIHNKMLNKHLTLQGIYDISAIRILVGSVSECYTALGIVHANFVPVDGRFKDYIAHPKLNGYKSLHTTVYYEDEFFEVQIRTYEMHEYAEYGVAAHFLYKEHKKALGNLDNKLLWIRKLLENKEDVSTEKLLEELKTDVYLGEIFVQTPMGKVIKLLENSTPIDFAYQIHSDVGHHCVGAKINGLMLPLTTPLSNGDIVEIITSPTSKGPSRDWLKVAKMQATKEKINYFYKKQMKEENIKLGKSMVEQYARSAEVPLSSIMRDEWIDIILKKNAFVELDELYAAIGYGSITAERVVNRLINLKRLEEQKNKTVFDDLSKNTVSVENKTNIIGAEGTLTKFCKCCNPIPGDDIVGYVSRGRGIIIHKKTCENVAKLPESRFIKVDWNYAQDEKFTFSSIVEVVAKNTNNVYVEITNVLSGLSVKVTSLNTSYNKNGELVLRVGIMVKDRNELVQVKNKISSLASVYEVK